MPALTPAGFGSNFSQTAFRLWERVIHDAIENYPKALYVDCKGRRPESIATRIREAARGFNTHNYTSYINRHTFYERWPMISIQPADNGQVILCDKNKLPDVHNPASITQAAGDVIYDCQTLEQLKAFLYLANFSCFRSIPIKLVGLDAACTNFLLNDTYQIHYPNTFVDVLSHNEAILL